MTNDLDRLDALPLRYYEGREDATLGIKFRVRAGELQEDSDARYLGHCDVESGVTALERAKQEEAG